MASTLFDVKELEKMAQMIPELSKDFLITADLLDKHYNNVNIAKVSGGVIGVIGGGLAVGGAAAAPFTFGVSLVLSIVGACIATAGGATSGGALITRHFLQKKHLERVQAQWAKLQEMHDKLVDMPKSQSETNGTQNERIAIFIRTVFNMGDAVVDTAAASMKTVTLQAGVTGSRVFGRVVSSPLFLLTVLSLGLSVYDIVSGSVEIHKKTGSPAGTVCRKLAKRLEEFHVSQIHQGDSDSD
ncbi:uncharacterized protein [Littorina saxatilis]|uniref:Uncharacterized protein n=1 Tax=Littorina saxatilis TaxID=31220 RepID=A0AAN9AKM8_9CAEN